MEKLKIVNSLCLASKNRGKVKDYIKKLIDNKTGGYTDTINVLKIVNIIKIYSFKFKA